MKTTGVLEVVVLMASSHGNKDKFDYRAHEVLQASGFKEPKVLIGKIHVRSPNDGETRFFIYYKEGTCFHVLRHKGGQFSLVDQGTQYQESGGMVVLAKGKLLDWELTCSESVERSEVEQIRQLDFSTVKWVELPSDREDRPLVRDVESPTPPRNTQVDRPIIKTSSTDVGRGGGATVRNKLVALTSAATDICQLKDYQWHSFIKIYPPDEVAELLNGIKALQVSLVTVNMAIQRVRREVKG